MSPLSHFAPAVALFSPANAVLASLPQAEYARIAPHLHSLKLNLGDVLHRSGEVVDRVYFVNSGILSFVLTSDEGTEVEVGLIGCEGAACALAALSGGPNSPQVLVQSSGEALFLAADQLHAEFARGGEFARLILRHIQISAEQSSQVALCNRLHSVEERLARWILMVNDRVQSGHLELTQEFLAGMLGSRRAGVTLAAGVLKRAGLIEYARGKITILDREGLEDVTCECYDILHQQFQRALES